MGGERARAFGLTQYQLAVIFAVAELDGIGAAVEELGLSRQTIKNHLNTAHKKAGVRSTLTLYHRLVRGIRFETHVTTKVVLEED